MGAYALSPATILSGILAAAVGLGDTPNERLVFCPLLGHPAGIPRAPRRPIPLSS